MIFNGNKGDYDTIVRAMNGFRPVEKQLEWIVEQPTLEVNFLNVMINLLGSELTTKRLQKPDNTYLYCTPTSCQPECYLQSFVFGSLHQYYWQILLPKDYLDMVLALFQRLLDRGHNRNNLLSIFKKSLEKVTNSKIPNPQPTYVLQNKRK